MTLTRYYICKLAKAFGYERKNIRMSNAAAEMHLLNEAESHLGRAIWEKVEHIDELSVEYWNLRKLIKEHARVSERMEECRKILAVAHEERALFLGNTSEPFKDLTEKRQQIISEMEELARQKDVVVARAHEIRRSYDGTRMKDEVLENEGKHSKEEIQKNSEKLGKLKSEFTTLKQERLEIADKIQDRETRIDEIETEMEIKRMDRKRKASEAFHHFGDANQEMSALRAELGVLNTRMSLLYSVIGKHVSRNTATHPECKTACQTHSGLVDVMQALRKSIQYNHRLAGNL